MKPPLISWPCYEPAGYQAELTEADLLQHVLIIGSTGSGKTTLLTSAARQLITRDALNPEAKIGLVLLDANAVVTLAKSVARPTSRPWAAMVFHCALFPEDAIPLIPFRDYFLRTCCEAFKHPQKINNVN